MNFFSPDNYVYAMSCGHELDSPMRRTEGVTVQCSMHGPVRLVAGDFIVPGANRDALVCTPAQRGEEKTIREIIARVRLALDQGQDDRRKLDKIINLVKPF